MASISSAIGIPILQGAAFDMVVEPSQNTMSDEVQNPNEIVCASFTEITQLKGEIAQLRATNAALTGQVLDLKHALSDRFPKFRDFPFEIRSLIWKFALTAPQIHIMRKRLFSRSQTTDVMQSCREARGEGLKLKLPFFKWGNPDNITNYMNLSQDIVWITDYIDYSPCYKFYCSTCLRKPLSETRPSRSILGTCSCNHRLGGMAFDFYEWEWEKPWQRSGIIRSASILNSLKVDRVYVVVNLYSKNSDKLIPSRQVRFLEPKLPPAKLIGACVSVDERTASEELTYWSVLAAERVQRMEVFKKERTEQRQKELLDGKDETYLREQGLYDLSEWIVPSVSFVEAHFISNDWGVGPNPYFC